MMMDVPDEVYAALRAASDARPAGPAPEDPAERVEWWDKHARADEVAQQAYERLHEWSIATEQHPVFTFAFNDVAMLLGKEAREGHAEARRARREESR